MVRDMNFAGSFYPREKDEVLKQFGEFNKILDENLKDDSFLQKSPKAVIVPHAGYVYSGLNGNIPYRSLKDKDPKNIVVIGPSHHHYFEEISLGEFDSLLTPLGELECDKELIEILKEDFKISMVREAHMEHSTEVQFPFIKHYFPHAKVTEIVYGHFQGEKLEDIVRYLLDNEYTVVMSTDLSHFHSLENAEKLDNICLEAVKRKDVLLLDKGCEACGKRGVKAIIEIANERSLTSEPLYYNTSADASGDKSRVVGYLSSIFY